LPPIKPTFGLLGILWMLLVHVAPTLAGPNDEALDALVTAYPEQLSGHDTKQIYWRDGTGMRFSDGVSEKTFAEMLANASILDQLRLPYRRGAPPNAPEVNDDPGRFRNEPFFVKMYGDCRKGQVAPRLAPVVWLPRTWGRTIWVNRVNDLPGKLRAVSTEIDGFPDPVKRAAYPPAGIFACRGVKDTGRLSMHAFAAAIDLNLAFSDYWLWAKPTLSGAIPYRNRMPMEIVEAFERHGFIWGGKWYHYDTMHFEYRPELLPTLAGR
jgi:hypothetical protein